MDLNINFWRRSLCYITSLGDIPSHVGIIMDGNRRFALKNGYNQLYGHEKGSETLSRVLTWCYYLKIKTLTVFALSTENMKRSKDELDHLMKLTKTNFDRLYNEKETLMKYDIKVEVVGNLTEIDPSTLESIQNVTKFTKNHSSLHLIIAFNYSSKYELVHAVKCYKKHKKDSNNSHYVNKNDFYEFLLVKKPLDLVIRTSGECRLSDFLLYQSSHAMIKFIDCYWPEFTFLQFISTILEYKMFIHWKRLLSY